MSADKEIRFVDWQDYAAFLKRLSGRELADFLRTQQIAMGVPEDARYTEQELQETAENPEAAVRELLNPRPLPPKYLRLFEEWRQAQRRKQ
jgi:hypothetical protein